MSLDIDSVQLLHQIVSLTNTMISLRTLILFFVIAVTSVAAGTSKEGLEFLAKTKEEPGVVATGSGLL